MFRENWHRTQWGNYHCKGLRLYVTDDYGNAVQVEHPERWQHPEFQD